MKKRDNQKMNMYGAVLQTCRTQQTVWENIPDFVASVNELENRLSELNQIHAQQDTVTSGVTAGKRALRAELTDHLYVISKALAMKGLMTQNNGLYSRNKVTFSAWNSFSGNALMFKAAIVMADVELYGSTLSGSGITPEFILETQALIASVNEVLYSPRAAIISKKALTKSISEQRQKIDQILNEQLDALIVIFKNSLPVFFDKYQNARAIIQTSHGTKTPPEPDDGGSDV